MNPLDSFTVERLEQISVTKGFPSLNVVRDLAKIALAAKRADPNNPEVPDGWVMVPKEPTIEMREAFHKSYDDFENCIGECPDSQWAAMIAAAPKPDHIVGVTEKVSDEWIKCSERLPEGKGDVQLFCSDTREQLVGFHKGKGIFQFFSMNDVDGVCEPTHWMPLPAAPKPEISNG